MMNIRKATANDAQLLAELNAHVQQIHADAEPHIFKPATADEALSSLYTEWLRESDATIFIAEVEGKPAGYIYALVINRPENPFSYARCTVLVDQMSVNPEYYGTGVADKLMQAVKELAHDHSASRIVLDVWDFNQRARRFYEKQGFKTFNYRMQLVLE